MKILYLDDSGKIHANHNSKFFVFGGFSVEEGKWHRLVKQIAGAKSNFFPQHGPPYQWEMKSTDFLTGNAWRRKRRRGLCFEIANILKRNACYVYLVSLEKGKAGGALVESRFLPLAFQRIIAKFEAELQASAETGTIVCDWSSYQMDRHLSNCVTSMVITKKMDLLRGGVTYGSSSSLLPLQVADLVAGTFQRSLEGQVHLEPLAERFRELRHVQPGRLDIDGHPIDSILHLF